MVSTGTEARELPTLATTLRPRHVSMIAFGGTIGAGIFVGSGAIIAQTGPAVVVCFLVVGLLAAVVMRLLSVLTQQSPDSGAFATYAGTAFGHIGRFSVGWLYWWLMVVTSSVECGAAASIAKTWLPDLPQWAWALMFTVAFTVVNAVSARVFGETQFWLSLAKVVLVIAVPVVGLLGVLGILPGVSSPGVSNITNYGGLVPNGAGAVVGGVLVAAFSFVGLEMGAIASAEADRPRRVVRRSLRIVTYTTLACYVLAMAMTVLLKPWNSPEVAASPFGAMMRVLHFPATTLVINIVVFTAVLSVLNSCLYAASRVGFALAVRGDAPKTWRRVTRSGVPRAAVLSGAIIAFGVTLVDNLAPGNISNALIDSSGAVGIMVWIGIALSYAKLRPTPETWASTASATNSRRRLTVAAWFVALVMFAMLISMIFLPATQLQLVMTMVPVMIIFVVVLWRETNVSADPDW